MVGGGGFGVVFSCRQFVSVGFVIVRCLCVNSVVTCMLM